MSNIDFKGARASNAGDRFHQVWALRHILRLLEHSTSLKAITVEGLPFDSHPEEADGIWAGVDCALFYVDQTTFDVNRIVIEQLKYSPASAKESWTLSDFVRNTAKKGNNSTIRRLAEAYSNLIARYPQLAGNIEVRFVSNRPIADSLVNALRNSALSDKNANTVSMTPDLESLFQKSGLSSEIFLKFTSALDLTSQTGPRFQIKENIVSLIGSWVDDDASLIFSDLLSRVQEMMMPESSGKQVTSETVLSWFGFHSPQALFPCPKEIKLVDSPVIRSVAQETVARMLSGVQKLCLHGSAGCGKTTVLQEIQALLPPGSTMIVFDCFGSGRYLESNGTRHRPGDAFLQLCNELATELQIPFLLKRDQGANYAKSFSDRLHRASPVLNSISKDALLVIAVDAADNSITAAQKSVPPEPSFVSDFVMLGGLPPNVRLLVTARTGRLNDLRLPSSFTLDELEGFTEQESAKNAERIWSNCTLSWLEEFHHFSEGNPRVQGYALDYANNDQQRCLDYLRPTGKRLFEIFEKRLTEAAEKSGVDDSVRNFCGAIAVMPRPIPPKDLANVSGLTVAQVRDLCADLGEALRVSEDGIGFKDEDFEEFISKRVGDDLPSFKEKVAEHLWTRRNHEEYAATHVASALFAAGRASDITALLETEPEPRAITDPILRQQVKIKRLRTGMQVAAEDGSTTGAIRAILVGAEALKTQDAITELVVSNPDLAVEFVRDSTEKLVLQDADYLEHHGAFLFQLMLIEARDGNKVMVREYERRLNAWLNRREEDWKAKKERNPKHPDSPWKISAQDIAAQVESVLLVYGVEPAVRCLRSWTPRRIGLEVTRFLVPKLLASGKREALRQCLERKLIRAPWTLALMVPIAIAGQEVNISDLENALRLSTRRGMADPEGLNESWRDDLSGFWFDLLLTGCEILIARGGHEEVVRETLKGLVDPRLTHYDQIPLFNPTRIVILLRARALKERLDGIELTGESFLGIASPDKEGRIPSLENASSQPYDERREEALRFFRACVPFFDRRAELIVGKRYGQDANNLIRESLSQLSSGAGAVARSYDYARILPLCSAAIASLGNLLALDQAVLFKDITDILFPERAPLTTGDEAFLSVFSFNRASHGRILSWITEKSKAISGLKTVATEKIEALLPLARFLLPISREDAKAIFITAHQITDEMDRTAVHQLKCLASLVKQAKQGIDEQARRSQSGMYYSIVTDAALRLAGEEGFPWKAISSSLASFDLSVAFASLARWEDSGITDRDTCLAAILLTALDEKSITDEEAAALLPLLHTIHVELMGRIIKNLVSSTSPLKSTIIDAIARDVVLHIDERWAPEIAKVFNDSELPGHVGGLWTRTLLGQLSFLSKQPKQENHIPVAEPTRDGEEQQPGFDISPSLIGEKCSSVSGLEQIIQLLSASAPHLSTPGILEYIRTQVPLNKRVDYLRALCSLKETTLHGYSLGPAISIALNEWQNPAVLEWKRRELGAVISTRLPELSLGITFERQAPIIFLLEALPDQVQEVPKVLIEGIAANVERLDAPTIYGLVSEIVRLTESSRAGEILSVYLKRLITRVPDTEIDKVDFASVPTAFSAASARYLFALSSDCDVRIRWRAARAIRRLARFGSARTLHDLLALYSQKTEPVFRAPGAPFYWMSARLWLMIALCRVANETPSALKGLMKPLFDIAVDQDFPHVLIRAFAKDAVTALSKHPHFKLSPRTKRQLDRANRSNLPRKTARKDSDQFGRNERPARKTTRYEFDIIDTIPYWYEPSTRMFADVSLRDFIKVADSWIADQWKPPSKVNYWDSEPRRNRYRDRDWHLWSHSHGGTPTVERYSTYLEWNAMWCTIGTLLKSRPLAKSGLYEHYSFENRLRDQCLAAPPYWLADLRCIKPLEGRFWFVPSSPSWIDEINDVDFLLEAGITGPNEEMLVISARHDRNAGDITTSTRVNSALVQPQTAASLVRALQTVEEPMDYGLPEEESITDLKIDEAPYRLLSWISNPSHSSGIDREDPFRNEIGPVRLLPGISARRGLRQSLNDDATTQWQTLRGGVSYLYEQWSDTPNTKSNRPKYDVRSDGERLWISKEALKQHLTRVGFDLVMEIQVSIRKDENSHARVHSKEAVERRYDRVLVFRGDGSIEDAKGYIGTWRLPRSGARTST